MSGVASAPRRWCVGEVGYGVERCHSRAVMGWNGILLGDGGRHVLRGWRGMLGRKRLLSSAVVSSKEAVTR